MAYTLKQIEKKLSKPIVKDISGDIYNYYETKACYSPYYNMYYRACREQAFGQFLTFWKKGIKKKIEVFVKYTNVLDITIIDQIFNVSKNLGQIEKYLGIAEHKIVYIGRDKTNKTIWKFVVSPTWRYSAPLFFMLLTTLRTLSSKKYIEIFKNKAIVKAIKKYSIKKLFEKPRERLMPRVKRKEGISEDYGDQRFVNSGRLTALTTELERKDIDRLHPKIF